MDGVVRVVRTGVEPMTAPPQHTLRTLHPEIRTDDHVILWYGGLRFFDDPLTAIHAMGWMHETKNRTKLLFVAFEGDDQHEESVAAARQLVSRLGLTGSVMFDENVPEHLQSGLLAEADLAIMLGTEKLEAKLHEPVGLTACIGAGLPMIITVGRSGSSLVQRFSLGRTVPADDVATLVQAITECLGNARSSCRDKFKAAQEMLARSKTIEPLVELCQQPRFALEQEASALLHPDMLFPALPEPTSLWELPAKTWQTLSQLGVRSTIREAARYLRWRMGY
jgi:hypothetical protein